MKNLKIQSAALVYQTGIANVFDVSKGLGADKVRRILQADFRTCENFTRGLAAAGVAVDTWSCNVTGDCAKVKWIYGTNGTPFRDNCRPVISDAEG